MTTTLERPVSTSVDWEVEVRVFGQFETIGETEVPDRHDRIGKLLLDPETKSYSYLSEDDKALFGIVRGANGETWLRCWHDGTNRRIPETNGLIGVPYRLPQLLDAVADNRTVFVVENEEIADRFVLEGLTATTVPGGIGSWRDEHSGYFRDASVVIIHDGEEGLDDAEIVFDGLRSVSALIGILPLRYVPEGDGIGGTKGDRGRAG
jgi:hypothetical protein